MNLEILNRSDFIVFTTREFANQAHLSLSAASKQLRRLENSGMLKRITKGIWANTNHPWFHPNSCVPYLLGKEQGYVSFLTALHIHGLLSQIPKSIQIATTGHSRKLDSEIARFEFLQIKPELMQQGVEWSDTQLPYLLASPEKAVIDVLYIATRKNRRFSSLPELTLTKGMFSNKAFSKLFKQLPLPARIVNAMKSRANDLGISI